MYVQRSAALRRFAPLAFAIALAAPASTAAAPACAPAAAKVLEASGPARLYSVATTLYGCLGSTRTRLGALAARPGSPATRVARYVLTGRFAAIDTVVMGVDTFSSTLSVRDLRSGARLASAPAAKAPARPESFVSVTQMALNRNGVLAWVARSSSVGQHQPRYGLFVLEHRQVAALAAGTVPLLSLRLTHTAVSWQFGQGGPRKSDPLVPG
jgi:hypothetical protein